MKEYIIKITIFTLSIMLITKCFYPEYEIIYDMKKECSIKYSKITGKSECISHSRLGGYEWNKIRNE